MAVLDALEATLTTAAPLLAVPIAKHIAAYPERPEVKTLAAALRLIDEDGVVASRR